ncbi:MAG: hypothetical protein F9B45_07260 [Phycisphaera sp. RhM]|nr:hypothetical protein [Phycisphaera sp. RhM]
MDRPNIRIFGRTKLANWAWTDELLLDGAIRWRSDADEIGRFNDSLGHLMIDGSNRCVAGGTDDQKST